MKILPSHDSRPPPVTGAAFERVSSVAHSLGPAAGVLFAPQINAALRNIRRQLTETAAGASDAAAVKYRDATTGVGDAVDDLQQKGRAVYGKALSAVVRTAENVRERATDAQVELEQAPHTRHAARREDMGRS